MWETEPGTMPHVVEAEKVKVKGTIALMTQWTPGSICT